MALVPALLLAACGGALPDPAPFPERPQRVVSINPCADALLREIADDRQIRAISHYSKDPRASSVPAGWAARFPATTGTAEEVLAARPDLVIAGPHVAPSTLAALRRLGIPLVTLPVPASIAESEAQIVGLGRILGQEARAAALAARIRKAEARARAKAAPPPASALVWQGGGLVPGPGTLIDELLAASGHANSAADHGLGAWGVLGLERLVAAPPAILYASDRRGEGDRLLDHPVVAELGARIAVVPTPARLMFCAGPTIIAALDHFAAGRAAAHAR